MNGSVHTSPLVLSFTVLIVLSASLTCSFAADVFFVDGTAFLITLSRNVKFITAEHTPVCTARALVKYIEQVLQMYWHTGFIVRTILMDG